jgi:nitrogen fixation negative regulator NifL
MTQRMAAPDPRLIEQIPAIVYIADFDHGTTYVSPQVERILGVSVEAWMAHSADAWGRRLHADDRARVLATFAEGRRRGQAFRCQYRFVRDDGRVVWLLDEVAIVRDDEGRPVAFQGVALDVTEQKLAEEEGAAHDRERQTLQRISEIALAGHAPDEAYRRITAEMEAATGCPIVAIALYEPLRDRLTFKGLRGVPGVDGGDDLALTAEESLSGQAVRRSSPVVWTYPERPPVPLSPPLAAAGARMMIAVPMIAAGRVIGAISLGAREPRPVDERLLRLAAGIANHVAGLVERVQAEEALAERERQFRTVFESALDPMLIIDDRRTYVAANSAAAALWGVPVAELIGHRFGEFAAPGTDVDAAWAAVHEGRLSTGRWQLVRPDGAVRDVESSVRAHFRPGQHLFVMRDVTERKRADAERRVRSAALTAAANGIVITDAEGRIEWANPEFTRTTGYTLDEARGQTSRILKSGRHDAAFYGQLWKTIRSGQVWRGEMVNRRKDGSLYHEEMSITPVRQGGHTQPISHFVSIKQDISERRRAEEHLRHSEEYYRSLIENALDLIVVLDADGVIRYASPSVERVLGERPDALVGVNALERLHPEDLPIVAPIFFSGQTTPGFTASAEYRFRHADGSWRTLEGVGRNLLDHPSVAGIIVNARDVTERKRAEETQERLRQQLTHSEKLAAMSELLAGVAHELNNPLSVVIGHTALLAHGADGAVAARAEKISRAAERCGRIVKNFLALARQYPPERTAVDLNQAVRDALEMMAYPLRVDNVKVVAELDPELPMLAADPHQLQQVLVNLTTNAHQAMRGVDGPRRLTVRTGADGVAAQAWLEVSDSGPGIPPDVEARLFEPFFTTKPVGQGTGLGLSICQGIVEGHGGAISVDGGLGRGATFRIVLPIGAPAPAAGSPEDEGPVVSPRRILVVDDETEVAAVVSEMLHRDGHEVTTAMDGADALARLRERPYDAIVSDIKMPGWTGRLSGPPSASSRRRWPAASCSSPAIP